MNRLYSSPLRVYLLLSLLAIIGIYSGFKLPISLFPNSSKPKVGIYIGYGSSTAEEFQSTYGNDLEQQLRNISSEHVEAESVEATYRPGNAGYKVLFKWGVPARLAEREVQAIVNSFSARLPLESRDSVGIWLDNENSGFFAASFFSDKRSPDELYEILEPILSPKIIKVKDALDPGLYNPTKKEIHIEIKPEAAASLQIFPKDIENALRLYLGTSQGGSLTVGTRQFQIQMPRRLEGFEDLPRVAIPTPFGKTVNLSDVAQIDIGPSTTDSEIFKTSGAPSLILFAKPRAGGNVKKMSEDIISIIKTTMPVLPPDIGYRILVDPSEFIRAAVNNVFHEVTLAALLAVGVLFLFIGSVRNVITASIEIPLSMVLAFILMRLFGMNLNLISLGGLALSAGMNVDASVVVMENIFRHFEMKPGPHSFEERLKILTGAVREIQFPVIASTIASLVVFLPLTFTSELTYAILGDLAKAVCFSHGFSAIVALILVPTVRLHLMKGGNEKPPHSPIESRLKWVENTYGNLLERFLEHARFKWFAYGGLAALLLLLSLFVLPRLPKEVIGKPDTDWMVLGVDTDGNTLSRQMEVKADETEKDLLSLFGPQIQYTFTEVQNVNHATIMARLKNKHDMQSVWKAMEVRYTNTPFVRYWVGPWNPSELPIPDPPHLRIEVRGPDLEENADAAQFVSDLLREEKVFPNVWTNPGARRMQGIYLEPHPEQWAELQKQNMTFGIADLADLVRVVTDGRRVGKLPIKDRQTDIILQYPQNTVLSSEDIAALPIGIGSRMVPLKALASVDTRKVRPTRFHEDGRPLFVIYGKHNRGEESKTAESLKKSKMIVSKWEAEHPVSKGRRVSLFFEDPAKDVSEAMHQLSFAVALSVGLIFLTMLIQFGSFVEPLLVLTSVPLGFIGVLLSLFIFQSTFSLNSILGVILLNGIAVANSILLVDFIKKLVESGLEPRLAAVTAAKKRLRPILITSLTTVLGMLPVAIGLGEGGRILQPLGIAVSGGLWISMVLTLFLVPALQVGYLEWRKKPRVAIDLTELVKRWPIFLKRFSANPK